MTQPNKRSSRGSRRGKGTASASKTTKTGLRTRTTATQGNPPGGHDGFKNTVVTVLGYGVKAFVTLALGLVAIALIYASLISDEVTERFDGRRWSVPSRVYSDGLILYPGLPVPKTQLIGRLDRLGYRRVTSPPKAEGLYRVRGNTVTAVLRAVDLPVLSRPKTAVKISFSGKQGRLIRTMTDAKTKAAIPVLELEPEEIMQVFGRQHESRQLVSVDAVPKALINAVLSAEDAGFFEHFGVDFTAIARALYVNVKAGGVRQGGSTLTQQLAKTFFLTPDRTIVRKLKELVIAFVIEAHYDKKTILEIYLNEIYLGQRGSVAIHGFGEAARFYFGKTITRLDPAECATLAGIIRGPNRYSPYAHPDRARARRDQVLRAMAKNGHIDEQVLASFVKSELGTVAFSPYQRTAPYFFDYLASQLATMYPQDDLSRIGLSMYTTLDVGVQAEAERALREGLAALEKKKPALAREGADKRLQGAIVVLEPSTGNVIAMVGGRSYGDSQFNRITQARRQPGSAFKPFAYLAALDSLDLTSKLDNEPKTYKVNGKRWRPKNYGGESGGEVTLREALTKSLNLPTVDLATKIGLEPVIETARRFGITTPLKPELSLVLGSFEVSPLELAVAYAALAHDGVLPYALSLKSVVNEDGKVVRRQHLKIRSVTTPARAYMMTSVLRDVVDRGTAQRLKRLGINFPVAGKTGTTNDYRDAWFVGYTPDLVALVWVGFDDSTSIRLPASAAAVPIWADLMRSIRWRTSKRWFVVPEGVQEASICTETGLLATDGCPHTVHEAFESTRAPAETCAEHRTSIRRFLDAIGL